MQARVVVAAGRLVLGIGASRVVAQAGDAPADLVPRLVQLAQRRAEHRLGVAPDLDHAARRWSCRSTWLCRPRPAAQQACIASSRRAVGTWITAPSSSLKSARSVSSSRRALTWVGPVLRVAVLGAAVGDAVALGDEQVDVEADAAVAGERHLAHRRPEAAVAAVVVREHRPAARRRLIASTSAFSCAGSSRSGTSSPNWPSTWASIEPPMRMRPCAEVDQDQGRVARHELRRRRGAHVGERREGGDDQAHRRRHLLRRAVLAVASACASTGSPCRPAR